VTDLARRKFLVDALASLGLAAAVRGPRLSAYQAAAPPKPNRIDVHHHFAPPAWIAEVKGRPLLNVANTRWSPAQSIEDMDRGGVAAAVVSITNPGLWFGDRAVTNRLARACNEYGAKLVQDHPARFGLFAAMPLPDVDATLKEIEYAYDTLKVDGVGLLTSYEDIWLGNAKFRPIMEELNRRRAVVHVHPTAANCCRNLDYGLGPGSIEYGTDTTRAIIGVTFGGDAARFPDIRFIWSHAGGSAPFLAGRIGRRQGPSAEWVHGRGEEVFLRYGRCGQSRCPGFTAAARDAVADSVRNGLSARRHQPRRRSAPRRTQDVRRERPARDRSRERSETSAASQSLGAVRKVDGA
jgi:predicted TIM-barrel fold metal-dependent hydrolase